MRNTAIALAVAAVFAAAPAFAQDYSSGNNGGSGFFVDGNIGHSNFKHGPNHGSDTGYAVNGGYRWQLTPQFAIGPEIGYNDLGNIKVKNIFNSNPVVAPGKASLHGWTAGANAHLNLTPNWYVSGRTGLYAWNGQGLSNDINPVNVDRDSNGWYGDAGVGYDFSNHLGVGLAYNYYKAEKGNLDLSTDMWSVNTEYRF